MDWTVTTLMGVNSGSGATPSLGGLGGVCSPGSSPTKPSHSHSAQASPTNTLRPLRPRARSADESNKKVLHVFRSHQIVLRIILQQNRKSPHLLNDLVILIAFL